MFHYACIAEESNEVVLLVFNKRSTDVRVEKLPMLSEPVNSIYIESQTSSLMVVLKESMQMQQYNLRTHNLSLRKRPFVDVLKMFRVDETVESMFLNQKSFFMEM